MSLFAKPKAVLWVKRKSVNLYFDRKENNVFNWDLNLFEPHSVEDLAPLTAFLNQQGLKEGVVLVDDDVIITKSFIYDSVIKTIEKKEVISLAESFIPFKIDPQYLNYELFPGTDKTLIRASIGNKIKMEVLKANLTQLAFNPLSFETVSTAVSRVISGFFAGEYFLIYPIAKNEYTLFLADKEKVYLTAGLKGTSLDIQKIINYAGLYFSHPIAKIFVPSQFELELNATSVLDKTPYDEVQIAREWRKAGNIPLPVLGLFGSLPRVIIRPAMENRKNYLPIIAVFIVTAAIASIVIWFILNRNRTPEVSSPVGPTAVKEQREEVELTTTPTPSVTEIAKDIKIQVLNATDINGQAAAVKEMLTKLGFTSVAIGNSKENVKGNIIRLKEKIATASSYFKAKLPDFQAEFEELPATSSYDAVFLIGVDLKTGAIVTPQSTATPTAKAAPEATTTPRVTISPTPIP